MQNYLKGVTEVLSKIYRWPTTFLADMSDERRENSFILQMKRIAKELGLIG